MQGLAIVGYILYPALVIFIVVMWVRLVFDLIVSFSRGWRPQGVGLVIAEAAYAVTDPPVKAVRRVVPPLKMNGVAIDFSWSIVLLAAVILSSVVSGFII
jgi:YggT family protein